MASNSLACAGFEGKSIQNVHASLHTGKSAVAFLGIVSLSLSRLLSILIALSTNTIAKQLHDALDILTCPTTDEMSFLFVVMNRSVIIGRSIPTRLDVTSGSQSQS